MDDSQLSTRRTWPAPWEANEASGSGPTADQAARTGEQGVADVDVASPAETSGLPTMADLDGLSADLDAIDAILARMDATEAGTGA